MHDTALLMTAWLDATLIAFSPSSLIQVLGFLHPTFNDGRYDPM